MHILFYLSMSSVFLVEDPERNVWTNGLWSATKTDEKVANTNKVPFVLLSALFISLPKDAKKIVWHLFFNSFRISISISGILCNLVPIKKLLHE